MTAITFVGANAGVSGNNSSLAPTIHASAVANDLMVLYATIRNTAAVVGLPAGWQTILADGNVLLAGKYHSGSESAPTVTFTGGSAGDDTLAQIAVLRTAALTTTGVSVTQTNTSAANIALPATQTPNRDGSVVLALGQKADDWTSVATLTGMTEIGETISTAGNDAGQVWDYLIQTTAAATTAGPFVVTGGTSAVSKSALVALAQKATVTVTEQDVYPPRTLVSVTNLIVGDQVAIYRVVAGERTLLRGGSTDATTDTSFLRVDAELPFNTPVSYVAAVEGYEYSTAAVTYTLPDTKVALTDAVSGASASAIIGAWPEKRYDRQASTFRVGGRNVVVAGDIGPYEADIELVTETESQRDSVLSLVSGATEGVIQIRSSDPVTHWGEDSYVAVVAVTESRWSQDGSDPKRKITLSVVEVEPWASSLEAQGFTYADLEAAYTGQTYADLAGDYATYLALAQADLS